MPTYDFSPPSTNGTVVNGTNLNDDTVTGTLQYQSLGSGVVLTTIKDALYGDGLQEAGAGAGLAGRIDTVPIAGGDNLMAFQATFKAPAPPSGGNHYLALGRNVAATAGSTGNVQVSTTNQVEFRNASDAVCTATGNTWGSPATARSIALTTGKHYKIDLALVQNTFTTRSNSNGRIIGMVTAIEEPDWISTGVNQFWFDSGYTANITVDNTNLFRLMKAIATAAVGTFPLKKIRWRSSSSPNTGSNGTAITKTNSIANFVVDTGPTVETVHTGLHYLIEAKATGGSSYAYDCVQVSGTVTSASTPVVLAPGFWRVDPSATEALGYTYTVTDTATGIATTSNVIVPQASSAVSGTYGSKRRTGGNWVGA